MKRAVEKAKTGLRLGRDYIELTLRYGQKCGWEKLSLRGGNAVPLRRVGCTSAEVRDYLRDGMRLPPRRDELFRGCKVTKVYLHCVGRV